MTNNIDSSSDHVHDKGTAFVIYEDIYDAKNAVDHLSGFNVGGRYLIVLYYQPSKFGTKADSEEKAKELEELSRQVRGGKSGASE
jgi:pre-mRNA branch site protein p14